MPGKNGKGQAAAGQDNSQPAKQKADTGNSGTASAAGQQTHSGQGPQSGQKQNANQQQNQGNLGSAQNQGGNRQHNAGGNHNSGGGGSTTHQYRDQHQNYNSGTGQGGHYQQQPVAGNQYYGQQDVYQGSDGNYYLRQTHHDGGGYYNSGNDGNQYPNWNYQGNYGAPRYQNQVGGWNPGTQYNPIPAPNVGNIP